MPREQRLVFGEVAELYDRARPTYPAELFNLIYAEAGLDSPHAAVVDIGAGTGKASMVIAPTAAERGWTLSCVEPDAAMAEVLRTRLTTVEGLTWSVTVSGIEQWVDGRTATATVEDTFDLMVAAQAYHWFSPERRLADCAATLRDGGTVALVWNVAQPHPPGLKEAIDAAYAESVPEGARPSSPHPAGVGWSSRDRVEINEEIRQSPLFGDPSEISVAWVAPHTTAEWIEVIQTHSDHRILEPDVLATLLDNVERAVDANGGRVDVQYDAVAVVAQRTPRRETARSRQP